MIQNPKENLSNFFSLFIHLVPICTVFLFVISVSGKPVTEIVAKIYHRGYPTELEGKDIEVIGKSVALSEKINMKSGSNEYHAPSIFFVIDNSRSMWLDENRCRRDSMGHRFTVTEKIIQYMADNPEYYQGVEVGVAIFGTGLFYDEDDDPKVLKTLPNSTNNFFINSGGYVPLLKLHKEYDTKNGTMKGSEILKTYLQTKIIGPNSKGYRYRFPTAPEDKGFDASTNINIGFRAAVDAMKSSTSAKENQFIIFISDGAATIGIRDYEKGFFTEEDFSTFPSTTSDTNFIPTTFTVFFQDEKGGHPESLDRMNDNIRNNGYSTSNAKYTQLWDYNNSNEEELFNFIKKNIISVIVKKQVWRELHASGASGPASWNEKSEDFILPSLIPLTGIKTPIKYNISFAFDSVATRFTRSTDNRVDVNYNVIIDHNLPQLESEFQAFYWERTLGFYDKNGRGIDMIVDEDIEFELKFLNNPKDAKYEYTNVNIEIRGERSGDIEVFSLTREDFQKFGLKVRPKQINGNGIQNNGTLECRLYDKLTATFRNSESTVLPLDTMQTSLIIKSDFVHMNKAIYFDNNANGRIDSIFIELSGECDFTDDDLKLIKEKIKLPEHRKFTINKISLHENGVGFNVSQNSLASTNTAVTDKDRVVIDEEIILEDEGKIFKGKVSVIDSVAPVIMRAQLVDYIQPDGEDQLTITFSEKIDDITKNIPFLFYSIKDDEVYDAKLRLMDQSDKKAVFIIISVGDKDRKRIGLGDSINIFKNGEVSDLVSNPQDNPGNIRREVEIEWIPTPFEVNVISTLKTEKDEHMYIQVRPVDIEFSTDLDSMSAEFNIYDAVGNIVQERLKMKYYKSDGKMYLQYKWNCRSLNDREVGRGTYLGVFYITAYFLQENGDILAQTEYRPRRSYLAVKD